MICYYTQDVFCCLARYSQSGMSNYFCRSTDSSTGWILFSFCLWFDKLILNLRSSFSSHFQLGCIYKGNSCNLYSFILLVNEILSSGESHLHVLLFWYTNTCSVRKVCPVTGSMLQCFQLNIISTDCFWDLPDVICLFSVPDWTLLI